MKGEIDHITSKIETLEMNQETAHTVSTRSLFLFLLIFLFLRSRHDPVNRTVNLKWSGGTNNWVTEIRVAINAITSLIWHQTWMYCIGGSWITKYTSKIQNSETKVNLKLWMWRKTCPLTKDWMTSLWKWRRSGNWPV